MKFSRKTISVDVMIPGGILATDFVHEGTNDDTCSRCRKPRPDDDVPLLVWIDPPKHERLLMYCEACISADAFAALAPIAPE